MDVILAPIFIFGPVVLAIFELAMIYVAFTREYKNKGLWMLASLLVPIGPLVFYFFVYRNINQK